MKDRSLDDLLASAIKGLNAMPARGTCFTCTDDDLKSSYKLYGAQDMSVAHYRFIHYLITALTLFVLCASFYFQYVQG